MSAEQDETTVKAYLKSFDQEQLNRVLKEVLTELRIREAEQLNKDLITHSKSLRLEMEKIKSDFTTKSQKLRLEIDAKDKPAI